MGNWSSSDVVANGIRLHVVRTGGDKPPLVLTHGGFSQGSQWFPMARILEADYDVIMYDLRSHGLSEAAPLTEVEDLAEDLVGLVGALRLEQPYLLGNSMGSWTVALAASRHLGLARAVVLDELPFDLSLWLSEQWVQSRRAERQKMKAMTHDALMAYLRTLVHFDEETLAVFAESQRRFAVEQYQVRRGPNIMMTDVVRRIACPVLMLVGDADKGSMLTPEMEREYAQIGGHVQVAHVSGAGHAIGVQQPEAWVRIVSAFLREQSVKR